MAELLSRNHSWGCKTMSKDSCDSRYKKTGQESSGIKSFGLTNQNLKSLGQIGGYMYDEELMKKLQPPVSHKP